MPPKTPATPGKGQLSLYTRAPASATASSGTTISPKPGSLDLLNHTTTSEPLPKVKEDGIYQTPLTQVGPDASNRDELLIMSNYVKVKAVPKRLWVYSLRFWRPNPRDKTKSIEFNKKREIGGAFEALLRSGTIALNVNEKDWATNFKELWTSKPLTSHSGGGKEWESPSFTYRQLSSKYIDDMRVTTSEIGTFDDIEQAMKEYHITHLSDYIRALNAHVSQSVLGHTRSGRLTQVGANKFYVNGSSEPLNKDIPDGLRAMRGYYTSIRPTKAGALLNVNTATSAFLPAITVSRLVAAVGIPQTESMLRGAVVRIAYRRKENDEKDMNCEEARRKVFQHFGLSANDQKFFKILEKDKNDNKSKRRTDPKDAGRTVAHYLRNDAMVDLNKFSKDELLCVNVGKTVEKITAADDASMRRQALNGASWVPAGLLEILPNQALHGLLTPDDTAEMIKQAVRLPGANAGRIVQEGLEILGLRPRPGQPKNAQLEHMGFQLDDKLISFAAKTLKMPSIYYGPPRDIDGNILPKFKNELRVKTINAASWDLRDVSFANAEGMNRLHILGLNRCFQRWQAATDQDRDSALKDIQSELLGKVWHSNMTAEAGRTQQLRGALTDGQLDNWFKQGAQYDCSVVMLEQKDYDLYSRLKRKGDLQYGQHIVCSVASKTRTKADKDSNSRSQYLANLTLKITMKMEGEPHFPDQAALNKIMGEERYRTMVVGADVTHPVAGSKLGCPSIACIVGSVDNTFMRYPGSMRLQAGGQEKIDDEHMCSMMKERLLAWKKTNDALPTSVLFYRDGVSESQFKICVKEEVPQIRKAYRELGGDDGQLKITFIIVGKRHHTRFFPTEASQSYPFGKEKRINGNLKPGLLVDSVVTNPEPYNFFLQSHTALQGTARPAHYHVLVDEMKLGSSIPELTLILCTTFGRATKVVSYAAPAYIADRLCERGRAYLRPWIQGQLPAPNWLSSDLKHRDGTPFTKDEFKQWRKDRALELARTPNIWGRYREAGQTSADKVRLNPWHPDFDMCMFWM